MRLSDRVKALAIVAALITMSMPSTAGATEDDAKAFFAQGRQLRLAKDCTNAIVAFHRALDLLPNGLGSLRNIAECEEELGQFASARKDWWELRRAVMATNDTKYDGWEKDAEEAYNRLAPRVAKLTVKIEGKRLERTKVTIDGKPLDARFYGVPLERDVGQHSIELAYGGAAPIVAARTLREGGDEVVTLAVPDDERPPVFVAPVVKPPDRTALRVGGFVALGIGVSGLATAGAFLAVRQGALSEIDKQCLSHIGCSTSLMGARDRGRTASVMVDVFGGVGIAGLAVATPLLILGYRQLRPAPASGGAPGAPASVSFTPAPGGGTAAYEVTF